MFRWPLLFLTFIILDGVTSTCTDENKPTNNIPGCTWDQSTSKDGCLTYKINCNNADIDEGCLLDAQSGPCSAKSTKYYYDTRTGKCSPFIYGGCSGNDNNFDSLGDCQDICINGKPRKRSDTLVLASSSGLNCTGKNEDAIVCGACDQHCDPSQSKTCSLMCRETECGCKTGFVRNDNNECVALGECNSSGGGGGGRGRATRTTGSTVTLSLATLIAQEIEQTRTTHSRPSTTTRIPRTRTTTLSTSSTSTTPSTTSTSTTTSTTTTTTPITTTSTTTTTTPPPLPTFIPFTTSTFITSTSTGSSSSPFRNPCDSINCPSYASCSASVCVPVSGSSCQKLRLAVPPSGCRYNYVDDGKGCQVPRLVCDDLQCGVNEEVKPCGACDPTCGAPVCITSKECGAKQCGCLRGYVRNSHAQCVQQTECPAKKKKKSKQ